MRIKTTIIVYQTVDNLADWDAQDIHQAAARQAEWYTDGTAYLPEALDGEDLTFVCEGIPDQPESFQKTRFRYYITNLDAGVISGTNSEETANNAAQSEDYFVADTETGKWLQLDNTQVPIEEF